jgi:Fic family protein
MKWNGDNNSKIILIFVILYLIMGISNAFYINSLSYEIQKCKLDNIIAFERERENNAKEVDRLYKAMNDNIIKTSNERINDSIQKSKTK